MGLPGEALPAAAARDIAEPTRSSDGPAGAAPLPLPVGDAAGPVGVPMALRVGVMGPDALPVLLLRPAASRPSAVKTGGGAVAVNAAAAAEDDRDEDDGPPVSLPTLATGASTSSGRCMPVSMGGGGVPAPPRRLLEVASGAPPADARRPSPALTPDAGLPPAVPSSSRSATSSMDGRSSGVPSRNPVPAADDAAVDVADVTLSVRRLRLPPMPVAVLPSSSSWLPLVSDELSASSRRALAAPAFLEAAAAAADAVAASGRWRGQNTGAGGAPVRSLPVAPVAAK